MLDPEIKPEILTVRIEQGSIGQGIRKTQNIPKRVDELVCYLGDLNVCSKQVGAADPFFLEVSKLGLPTGTLGEKNGKLGLFVIFRNNFTGFHRRWNEVGFWGIYSYCGCFVFVNEVKKRLPHLFSKSRTYLKSRRHSNFIGLKDYTLVLAPKIARELHYSKWIGIEGSPGNAGILPASGFAGFQPASRSQGLCSSLA